MGEPEVRKLIEYTQVLEGQVIENTQTKKSGFEDSLTELTRDVYNGILDIETQEYEHKRFGKEFPKPNYEEALKNLKKYFLDFAKYYRFRL